MEKGDVDLNESTNIPESTSDSDDFLPSPEHTARRSTSSTVLFDLLEGSNIKPQPSTLYSKDSIHFRKMTSLYPFFDFYHGRSHVQNIGGVPIILDASCEDFVEKKQRLEDSKMTNRNYLFLQREMKLSDVTTVYFYDDELKDKLFQKYPELEPFLKGPENLVPQINELMKQKSAAEQLGWQQSSERKTNSHIYTLDLKAYLQTKEKAESKH